MPLGTNCDEEGGRRRPARVIGILTFAMFMRFFASKVYRKCWLLSGPNGEAKTGLSDCWTGFNKFLILSHLAGVTVHLFQQLVALRSIVRKIIDISMYITEKHQVVVFRPPDPGGDPVLFYAA